jgi:hypothetical protein
MYDELCMFIASEILAYSLYFIIVPDFILIA